ncbi:MAG: carboxypeptidase-like regulatory domain-containing protein [Agarilytica sp.]
MFRYVCLVSLIISLTQGCGGSSGGGTTTLPTPTTSPTTSPTATPTTTPTTTVTPTPTPSSGVCPVATPVVCPTPTITPTTTPTPMITPIPTPEASVRVEITGRVTYDFVPHLSTGALDYDSISELPVRGATVHGLNSSGTVVAEATTDTSGDYTLYVTENTNIRVRVRAELLQYGAPQWHFSVTDNTSSNALYVMDGDLADSGPTGDERNLLASSGWTGSSYGNARVAAPFAILDSVYEALQHVLIASPSARLAPTQLRWSINNRAVDGSRSDGAIRTSFYDPSENNMYILGDENNDTDEYDKSVIQHELAHYLEDTVSRSDSLGGDHSLNSSLDMRVAFGEGFANAFSGIASGQPIYSDSSGIDQGRGFSFSLEQNSFNDLGWFSENSVGKVIYDIADAENEGVDSLALGFTPIYQAMTSDEYVEASSLTSIYLFAQRLRELSDATVDSGIDALLEAESIFGVDEYGTGETNDSTSDASFILPVYQSIDLGNTVNVCSNNREGEYNGVDNRRFIRLSITECDKYRFQASTTLGTGDKDPDIDILQQGNVAERLDSGVIDSEQACVTLGPGDYVVEVFDFGNVDGFAGGGSACFDVTIDR